MKFKRDLPTDKLKPIVKQEVPLVSLPDKPFETTDKVLTQRLVAMGFHLKETRSPFGERLNKLYVFSETEQQVKEKI